VAISRLNPENHHMPDCRETLEELERYLDSELPTERVTQIVGHLKGCTDCHGAYEFHFELREVIKTKALRDELPDGFADRLLSCFGDNVLGG
jgi:mycothiol system anti-sigma-R factor